jgi:tetratricopeptide (TPR) repeat protein
MLLNLLSSAEAVEAGHALAERFLAIHTSTSARKRHSGELERFVEEAESQARALRLGVWGRARLANSFKWKLLEGGLDRALIEELTRSLLVRLSAPAKVAPQPRTTTAAAPSPRRTDRSSKATDGSRTTARLRLRSAQTQLLEAEHHRSVGEMAEAAACLEQVLAVHPRNVLALNSYGATLEHLGRLREAEAQFRRSIELDFRCADAHHKLGNVLRSMGRIAEAEAPLRHALQLRMNDVDARAALAGTLYALGRISEAKEWFGKASELSPDHLDTLLGMAAIADAEGRFAQAEALFKRVLEIDPVNPAAWSALVWLRRVAFRDKAWLDGAEQIAVSGIAPHDEAKLRFSIGKYWDDLGDFERAFGSYRRANELHKLAAEPYDREARTSFVSDLIRVHTRQASHDAEPGSDSAQPVFVVGMPRSGTTLVEQIIASHPDAKGAGELEFWNAALRHHAAALRREPLKATTRRKLAAAYLSTLASHATDARRVVDKSTLNSDYLGILHGVFPHARMVYLQRDPIDTCLSCYFQQLSPVLAYTMDLQDLAHYYREHRRLMDHWRAALPPGTLLDVPYAELVAEPERWTRRIIDFLGLEWDERCLSFEQTHRPVFTASFWQVRQKIYQRSVGRWRHYERFISPLLPLAHESGGSQ